MLSVRIWIHADWDIKNKELLLTVRKFFLKKVMPFGTLRKFTKREIAFYNAPYPTIKSRKPLMVWPTQIPIDEEPADVH